VQSAEAGIKQAESQLESSKVDLEYTVIKSPIDGMVINRNINVGQTVAASFQAPVLFQIADKLDKMQVECSVDEADIGKVQEGQKVRFTVDAFPEENFSGRVIQVRYSPVTVQNVVTYTTIVQVDNPELKLRPGMTANASIVVGQAKDALLVSNAALRFTPQLSAEEMKKIFEANHKEDSATGASGGQPAEQHRPSSGGHAAGQMHGARPKNISRVWIIDEQGKLKPVFLKEGVTDNTYTEVLQANLKEGQKVIIGMESESAGGGPGSSSVRGIMRVMH
jgi:HlyD family secretion protein